MPGAIARTIADWFMCAPNLLTRAEMSGMRQQNSPVSTAARCYPKVYVPTMPSASESCGRWMKGMMFFLPRRCLPIAAHPAPLPYRGLIMT